MNQTGTVGIVGGGQLGRMLTEAATKLGFKVVVLNPSANSPAAQVGAEEIVGDLYDPAALRQLAAKCDYLTIEIEHLDAKVLEEFSGKVNPAPRTLATIQDKFQQKEFLNEAGIPVADFVEVTDEASGQQALDRFGGKILLKTRHGAYDGRGNAVVSSPSELSSAIKSFAHQQLYAEKFVPFKKELAVIIVRDVNGNVKQYPLVETIHERNICVEVLCPAEVNEAIVNQAEEVARAVGQHLQGAGVFAIEMFLTNDNRVLVNEIAPRVHNSGHHTIEACQTSQFENHILAITGLELGSTELKVPAAVMINILGERDGPTEPQGIDKAEQFPHTYVHLYGKSPTKVDRKMGHLTVTADSVAEAKKIAEAARQEISI
jgi:phosphoribosylaminoimidazole carboxylase PurK protein